MRARRSSLSVPARRARKLDKAPGLEADEIIIDLEDSVPADLKLEARAAVVEALAVPSWRAATVSIRINASSTPWFEEDLAAIAAAGRRLDSVVVPKVEEPADLAAAAVALDRAERGADRSVPVGLQALIESAAGLQAAGGIARAGGRLEGLILGPADMSVSLGFPSPEDGPRWDFVRGAILIAARAAGIQAIDGPFLQISDQRGLRDSALRARDLGFDGKWALHPGQVTTLNEVFSPSSEEVERAESILAALESEDSDGALMLEGEMIDEASRKRAEQTLARAPR